MRRRDQRIVPTRYDRMLWQTVKQGNLRLTLRLVLYGNNEGPASFPIVLGVDSITVPVRVPCSIDEPIPGRDGLFDFISHQDVAEDAQMGRIYLPLEDLALFGCAADGLVDEANRPALRDVVAHEVRRARELLAEGAPLSASLPFRARLAVAAFSAGGGAALDSIERA